MAVMEPRTVHLRDQVRSALVGMDPSDPCSVAELMEDLEIAPPYYQQVYQYLRRLEREGRVERWSDGDRRIMWSATPKMRSEFEIRMPPMRVVKVPPPNRRIKR